MSKTESSSRPVECGEDLIPTRKSLLGRLNDWRDNESWRDFFNTYWKLIYKFALHRGLNHQEAEEVVQETVIGVAKSIGKFEYNPGKCSFKTWLLAVTRHKIGDQFQRREGNLQQVPNTDDSTGTSLLERVPDESAKDQWEGVWEAEWRQNLMDVAIARVKRRVAIQQFQVFDLLVSKQWPARDVAKTLRISIAHVYVAKHRVSKLVREQYVLLQEGAELARRDRS